jgi:hypothetical protein
MWSKIRRLLPNGGVTHAGLFVRDLLIVDKDNQGAMTTRSFTGGIFARSQTVVGL